MYAPESPDRTPQAERLVAETRRSQGIIIGSPGYHGTLSGLVKNALDYIEDMREDDPPYLDGRAVGCIACAYGWQATINTLSALRSVVHALRGWPTPYGAGINTAGPVFDQDGNAIDDASRLGLELVGQQVVQFANMWAAQPA
jgi:FMN reductase